MNQLVYIENGRPVTDSLTVAQTFGKEHKHVMRDIRELECSEEFSRSNFGLSDYSAGNGKTYERFLITQDGFSFLVMGYTGKDAARFKESYIAEFSRMRAQAAVDITGLSPILQQLIQTEQRQTQLEAKQLETAGQVAVIKETIIQRDDDWRGKINGLLNGAGRRQEGGYKEVRRLSYQILEERGRCDLDKRLRNLKQRLAESGATKTRIDEANRLDIIEEEPRLKEIYTTIVKELAIGSM